MMRKRKTYQITSDLVNKYLEFEPLLDELWYMGVNTKRRLRLFVSAFKKLKKQGIDILDPANCEEVILHMEQIMKQIEALPNGPLYRSPRNPQKIIWEG